MLDATELRRFWSLDASVVFLNHGSYGACPWPVLAAQAELRARLEREPVQFFQKMLEPLLDEARAAIGHLLGADPNDLAFVSNATAGVNAVVRSLDLAPGDELLTTDHAYNACRNALEYVAARTGARVVVAHVPFPIVGPDAVVDVVLAAVTPRTKLALLDHVTSPTALVFPIAHLVRELDARGVDTVVDSAHGPGMRSLQLDAVGAAYTTGNFHKWLCAPKGAAFLHVRRDRQQAIRPLVISHGANTPRTGRSRFRLEFDWTGTQDPTAALCVPEAIRFLEGLMPGGLPALMERNRAAALSARVEMCRALGVTPPCPAEMLGSMAAVILPDTGAPVAVGDDVDPFQERLFTDHRIEVPVFPVPALGHRILRVSTPIYTTPADVAALTTALVHSRRGGARLT